MMGKSPATSIIALVHIFLLSFPLSAVSDSFENNFLRCLSQHSNSSTPISETIYTPSNCTTFSNALQSYVRNPRFFTSSTLRPLAIIAAKHYSHVQATVICSKKQGLQIRIRSGGHDYEGLSYVSNVPFVVLDMFNLRSIHVDAAEETAWVQAGATTGELYYKIAAESLVHGFPAGVCPTVGAGGQFSGGGSGNIIRRYGLSVDNIVDAEIVDAKGRILRRRSMGEDLFWAIRGGGGASYGVILAWKIKLVQVPEKVTVFNVQRTLEQGATDAVLQWQEVASRIDRDLHVRLRFHVVNGTSSTYNNEKRTLKVSFVGLFLGDAKRLVKLAKESLPKLGLKQEDCLEMSWIESTLFWLEFSNGTSLDVLLNRQFPYRNIFYKPKSDYVRNLIPRSGLEFMWERMIGIGSGITMEWDPYGGRMDEIAETETPFPHRVGVLFKIWHCIFWNEQGVEKAEEQMNVLRRFYEDMAPYVSKSPREAYLNYRDLDIGTNSSPSKNFTSFETAEIYGRKYFKGNFERLVRVKTLVDPGNFFRHEQSIPPLNSP